jgi:HK97 family phage portal protein
MGYLTNLLGALTGRPQASTTFDLTSMSPEQVRDFLRIGGSMETASGAVVNDNSAMRVAAAWRCVNIISGTVGSLPLDLIRRESEKVRRPATGHPLRKVLTVKPNVWQTPSEFRRMMQMHLLLRGNAYALKVRMGRDVVGLIPIIPDRVTVEQNADLSLKYQVTRKSGAVQTYQQAEILHLRGMTLDGVKGLSVIAHMRESLGLALQGELAGAKLMKNGQFASGDLKHPGKLSKEAYDRLKASIAESGGAGQAGTTRILEEGLSFDSTSMNATDMQFLEQRNFQRYDIAMFFGVPPHMIGATEKSTSWGSGIEQMGIGFVTYTLNDWLVTWQEALKRDVINESEWETLDVRFFPQALLKGDTKTQWDAFTKGRQWGVYSANDVRSLLDLNPREDDEGDEYAAPPNQNPDAAEPAAEPAEDLTGGENEPA